MNISRFLKSKAALIGLAGILAAFGAVISAVLGGIKLAIVFIAFSLSALIVVLLVLHRYLIRTTGSSLKSMGQLAVLEKRLRTISAHQEKMLSGGLGGGQVHASVDVGRFGNSVGETVFRGGVGPKFEYGERILKIPGKYETFALRTKSTAMRDSIARAATELQYDYDDVLRIVRTKRAGKLSGAEFKNSWNAKQLLMLARVVANQRLRPTDVEDAERLFRFVQAISGKKAFGRTDNYIYSEVLQSVGEYGRLRKFLKESGIIKRDSVHARLVELNILGLQKVSGWDAAWVAGINALFQTEGLSSIEVDFCGELSPLDSISGTSLSKEPGPKVTVIVPSFNGAHHLPTTLRALRAQTWDNIEIIVVDDGSTQENRALLEPIKLDFPEVIWLQQEENLGAYPARNRALEVATGEFITVHDDDDWSHPEKIARQAKHLLDNPNEYANMTRHARVSEELIFTRINNNPSFSQPNFSSLMFRKSLLAETGVWDNVNRGADAEFRDRLVNIMGKPVPVLGNVPLSFTRTHAGSLTAGEIGRGYIDPARLFYQQAYQELHKKTETPSHDELAQIARPINMEPGKRGKSLGDFDVIFMTDFGFPGGTSNLTLNEIEACVEAGLDVGMIHMFSPVNVGAVGVTERALQTASLPSVSVLSLKDELTAKHIVIRHPSVLQFIENLDSNVTAERVSVIINNPPVLDGGKGFGFDLETSRANIEKLFNVAPAFYPESGVTRQLASAVFSGLILSDENWPGILRDTQWIGHSRTPGQGRPVLGRHSRDAALKWPDKRSTIELLYGCNEVYDTRIMGGIDSLPGDTQKALRAKADVLGFDEESVPEFLSSLDFWAYFHSDALTESFGMSVIEAMAAGVVVILPEYMRANFGDAALYAEPKDVQGLVASLWSEPEKYKAQVETAQAYVQANFTSRALIARLTEHGAIGGIR